MAEFKALSVELLKLVVTNDRRTVEEIDRACKHESFDVSYEITFEFYRKGWWGKYCDCWYINEYFEYCTDCVDMDSFLKLSEYFTQGHCPHVVGQFPEDTTVSGISLIHAATAAGNIGVVKYIIQKNKAERLHATRSAEFLPYLIAVIKNQACILKVVLPYSKKDRRIFHELHYRLNKAPLFARRDPGSRLPVLLKLTRCYSNNFVNCFFLNINPSKKIIEIISGFLYENNIDTILRYVIHIHEGRVAANIVSAFAEFVSTFDCKIAVECVLWNKPEALSVVLQKVPDLNIRVYDIRVNNVHLHLVAKFLGHDECLKILLDTCRKGQKHMLRKRTSDLDDYNLNRNESTFVSRIFPFSIMPQLFNQSKMKYDEKSLSTLFLKISSQYDVNQIDEFGMTPVQVALETVKHKQSLTDGLEILFIQGADANIKDRNGRSALYVALTPFNSPRGLRNSYIRVNTFLRIIKLILYYNAVPKHTQSAVYYAVFLDQRNSLLSYIDDETAKVLLTTNPKTGKKIFAINTAERILALSYVAILTNLGFPVSKFAFNNFTRLPDIVHRYLNDMLSSPRTLESRCRNIIRETYPGPSLRKFLNSLHIPKYIVDVILFEPYLQRTQIILNTGDVIDDQHSAEDI